MHTMLTHMLFSSEEILGKILTMTYNFLVVLKAREPEKPNRPAIWLSIVSEQ